MKGEETPKKVSYDYPPTTAHENPNNYADPFDSMNLNFPSIPAYEGI